MRQFANCTTRVFLSLLSASVANAQVPNVTELELTIENSLNELQIELENQDDLTLLNGDLNLIPNVGIPTNNEEASQTELMQGPLGVLQTVPREEILFEIQGIEDPEIRTFLLSVFSNPTEREIECGRFSGEWLTVLQHFTEKAGTSGTDKVIEAINVAGKRDEFVQLASDYQLHCLADQDSVPQDLLDFGIGHVVGFVIVNGYPHCGALRIDDEIFVTAKHCYFNESSGEQYLTKERSTISLLAEIQEEYQIDTISFSRDGDFTISSGASFELPSDFLYLHTRPINLSMPEISLDNSQLGEEIILLGYFRFFDPVSLFNPPVGQIINGEWANGVRWADLPQCIVSEVVGQCMAHYCESDSIFSGSPLIRKSLKDGKISVAGLHVASMGANSGCRFDWSEEAGNIAITTPDFE